MHILVFPGWYPSRVDKLSGDFIQRHMVAISKTARVSVVFPVKDNSIDKAELVEVKTGSLNEYYYYYPSVSSISIVDNIISFLRYNWICLKMAGDIYETQPFDLTHIYVFQKNHLLGPLLNWFKRIPYVISEQSTFYVDGRLEKLNKYRQKVFGWLFNNANSFHAVSKYLLNSIKEKLAVTTEGIVIPNVVDADLFYYNNDLANSKVAFVHVSNMFYQKNVEGMLQAVAIVKKQNPNFTFNLVGPLPASIVTLIDALKLNDRVKCWHERNYKEVAEIMQQSDFFVFFTRYETFGCVIIEANACGLPVIVSDLEVTRELISAEKNGLFVKNENVQDLADKMLFAINHPETFDPISISIQTRSRFNYDKIGEQFMRWYKQVVPQ